MKNELIIYEIARARNQSRATKPHSSSYRSFITAPWKIYGSTKDVPHYHICITVPEYHKSTAVLYNIVTQFNPRLLSLWLRAAVTLSDCQDNLPSLPEHGSQRSLIQVHPATGWPEQNSPTVQDQMVVILAKKILLWTETSDILLCTLALPPILWRPTFLGRWQPWQSKTHFWKLTGRVQHP